MRIYLASSWRNAGQPLALQALRAHGHEVYDFRHPMPGNDGFAWREIDPDWLSWTPGQYLEKLHSPIARDGFQLDQDALDWCDCCILLLPCGRSAHLELGYCAGRGKETVIVLDENGFEPELMYRMASAIVLNIEQAASWLDRSRMEQRSRQWG